MKCRTFVRPGVAKGGHGHPWGGQETCTTTLIPKNGPIAGEPPSFVFQGGVAMATLATFGHPHHVETGSTHA